MLEGRGDKKLLENHGSISGLVALKPRQVLLSEQKKQQHQQQKREQPRLIMTKKQTKEQLNQKTDILEDDHKLALLHSVVKYISDKGFAKTLKKFLKEAKVQDEGWKGNSFNLEEMYCKYLENCRNGDTKTGGLKEQEEITKGALSNEADVSEDAPLEAVNQKKKKKNDDNAKSSVPEVKTDNSTVELKDKKKKKKNAVGDEDVPTEDDMKNKRINEGNDENAKSSVSAVKKDDSLKETMDKKKKKKKKSKLTSDDGVEVRDKEQSKDSLDNEADNKSKKRKRSASDESKDKNVEGVIAEESKRRKTDSPVKAEVKTIHGGDPHVGGETKKDNGNVQFGESEKGDLLNNGVERSSVKKSAKKQHNGSAEPKTVNAFQRVKVDAVEFADERLQDNSYWAKGGAETGYGAKAQEILGQVKGRDFRHEKTKKKRGSYRGGQIDLQSHSVKFNYSDEE